MDSTVIRWSRLSLIAALAGCSGAQATQIAAAPEAPPLCDAPLGASYAVMPISNKTQHKMELEGADDLITAAMSQSRCFTLLEREKVALLVDEMKLCADSNADRGYFDCGSFATKGKLLGARRMVMGNVAFFEEAVRGAELAAKLPEVGGLEAGATYSAIAVSLRVVNVEDGKVLASTVVHAVVPAGKGGLSVSGGGFELKLTAQSKTPMGESLHAMLAEAVQRLRDGLAASP